MGEGYLLAKICISECTSHKHNARLCISNGSVFIKPYITNTHRVIFTEGIRLLIFQNWDDDLDGDYIKVEPS